MIPHASLWLTVALAIGVLWLVGSIPAAVFICMRLRELDLLDSQLEEE